MTLLEKSARAFVGIGCAYEIASLALDKTPTISALCKKHRWLEGVFLLGLVVHFHYEYERKGDVCQLMNTEDSPGTPLTA